MIKVLLIALGGAAGAVARYGLSTASHGLLGQHFAYGTLMVNVLGSLLMGFLAILFLERMGSAIYLQSFFLIGLLGAFTTFSTFSLETLNYFSQGQIMKASLNILLNVLLCLIAVSIGVYAGRQL